MANINDPLAPAIDTIKSANISANDRALLKTFILVSLNSSDAAQYVVDRVSRESATKCLEETLLSLKKDLEALASKMNRDETVPEDLEAAVRERENNRCCLTGEKDNLKATYIVPPSLFDDDDLQPGGRLRPVLEACISTKLLEQLEAFLKSTAKEDRLQNMWLFSPSARHDFHHGHVRIRKAPFSPHFDLYSEEPDMGRQLWQLWLTTPVKTKLDTTLFKPTTPDIDRLPLPKRPLPPIHYVISLPLHYQAIEREIAEGWPEVKQDEITLGSTGIFFLRSVLRVVPLFIRTALYNYLFKATKNSAPDSFVRYLPFGLCLKEARNKAVANEANALRLVEANTDIPAPKFIDLALQDEKTGFLLMTRVHGDLLDDVFYRMTDEERKTLGKDLGKCITQLRSIPNKSEHAVTNTLGGPAFDHRFEDKQCGPYAAVTEFHDYLTENLEKERVERPLSALYEKKHRSLFTHSDLHRTNIFVKKGRLAGIVDWEHAGYKPEFWEYTKALWPYFADRDQKDVMREAFEEDYEDELAAEEMLWRVKPVF